jgi:ubiquitin C-terminal hydrolase
MPRAITPNDPLSHQGAHKPIALAIGIQKQRDQHAENQLNNKGNTCVNQSIRNCIPDALVAKCFDPVVIRIKLQFPRCRIAPIQRRDNRRNQGINTEHNH